MVLAGPGSGKTSVIVERTAYMTGEGRIPPENILVVTFSRAAAKEMKERFLKFTGQSATRVTFGTFHGVFYGILRQAYGFTAANILSEEEKSGILKELILNYGGDLAEEGDFPEEIAKDQCGQGKSDFSGILLFFLLPGRSIPTDLQWLLSDMSGTAQAGL